MGFMVLHLVCLNVTPPQTRGLPLPAVPPPVPLLVPVAPREEPLALTPGNVLTSVWQVPTFVSWGLSVGVAEVIWLNVTLFLPSNVFVDHPGLVSCQSRGVCLPKGCAPFVSVSGSEAAGISALCLPAPPPP